MSLAQADTTSSSLSLGTLPHPSAAPSAAFAAVSTAATAISAKVVRHMRMRPKLRELQVHGCAAVRNLVGDAPITAGGIPQHAGAAHALHEVRGRPAACALSMRHA